MKFKFLFFTMIAVLMFSCRDKEIVEPDTEASGANGTLALEWNAQEKQFFNLKNSIHSSRSSTDLYFHPVLIKTFNALALENERNRFIPQVIQNVGMPLWKEAKVTRNKENDEFITLIPFYKPARSKTTGVLVAHSNKGTLTFTGVQRNHVLSRAGHVSANAKMANIFIAFDQEVFGGTDETMKGASCFLGENEHLGIEVISNETQTAIPSNCAWRLIEVCTDFSTQTIWIVNEHPIPIHLDHDQDGIMNDEDQDWWELSGRFNITQDEFTESVLRWWEREMEDDWGEYEDFAFDFFPWEDYPDDDFDWEYDFWDDLNDLWDDLSFVLDEWWYWFNGGDPNEDRDNDGYPDGNCPWHGGLAPDNSASSRQIRCDVYYVLDCGTGTGDSWMDYFVDVVSCPDCDEYDEGLLEERLLDDIWRTSYKDRISFENFIEIVGSCDFSSPHHAQCVKNRYNEHVNDLITKFIDDNRIDPSYTTTIKELFDDPEYCQVPLTEGLDFYGCLANKLIEGMLLRVYNDLSIDQATKDWLKKLGNTNHITEIFTYLNEADDYDPAEISYIFWAIANNGNDLEYYLDRHKNFAGSDQPFTAEQIEGIAILSSEVPDGPPTNLPKLGETPFREGHEYDPAAGIIPQDLQYGTDGDAGLVFTSTTLDPITILDKSNDELMDIFYNLISSNLLNSDLPDVAYEYHSRWHDQLGEDYFNQELSEYVLNNEHMIQTAIDFAEFISKEIDPNNGDLTLIDWSKFTANYRAVFSEKFSGLGILVNDTEQLQVFDMGDFVYNMETGAWSGTFYFRIYDNFGLDNDDLLDYQGTPFFGEGFQAWWILQHLRGYQPFRTEIRHVVELQGITIE